MLSPVPEQVILVSKGGEGTAGQNPKTAFAWQRTCLSVETLLNQQESLWAQHTCVSLSPCQFLARGPRVWAKPCPWLFALHFSALPGALRPGSCRPSAVPAFQENPFLIQVGEEEELRAPFTPKPWTFTISFVLLIYLCSQELLSAERGGKWLTVNYVNVFLVRDGSLFLYWYHCVKWGCRGWNGRKFPNCYPRRSGQFWNLEATEIYKSFIT